MPTTASSANLPDRLVSAVNRPDNPRATPGLYRVLLRLLAHGEPVTVAQLAAAAGRPTDDVQRVVSGWADTEYDQQRRIIGWALTLNPTPHKFSVDGKQLYTWCALDTLFFPAVLGRPANIESPCAATGVPIRLTVDPVAGITALNPATAAVSVVTPEQMSSVKTGFCDPGRFFATPNAACEWQAKHPGMEILSVADAHRVSRPLSDELLNE